MDKQGHQVTGTFRTQSPAIKKLSEAGVDLVYADLSNIGI